MNLYIRIYFYLPFFHKNAILIWHLEYLIFKILLEFFEKNENKVKFYFPSTEIDQKLPKQLTVIHTTTIGKRHLVAEK